MPLTQINHNQIPYGDFFNVQRVLASRGFRVASHSSSKDTILDKECWSKEEQNCIYKIFKKTISRTQLLDYIDGSKTNGLCRAVKNLVKSEEFIKDRERFSKTFEWFIGELFVREFMAYSHLNGVKIQNISGVNREPDIGDFDVMSILGDMRIIYVECKSGNISNISANKIKKAINRHILIHGSSCIIFVGQGTNENHVIHEIDSIKKEENSEFASWELHKIQIPKNNDSFVYKFKSCYIIPSDKSFGSIVSKFETSLRLIEADKNAVNIGISAGDYNQIGFDANKLL